jgi:DNA-binding GntR family transcriptional regulator
MAGAKTVDVTPLRRSRLFDEVTDHLRDLILSGQIPPGTQLLQIELAHQLGVSRTPLREAFRILERDGLIRVSNGNKTVEVVSLADEDAIETYEVREVLDGLAARLAAQKGLTKAMERRLSSDLDKMDDAIDPLVLARYSNAHADFHLGIVEASANGRLLALGPIIRLSSQMVLSRRTQLEQAGNAEPLDNLLRMGNADHRLVLERILAGDAHGAENAARRHVARTRKQLRLLEPPPQARRDAEPPVAAVAGD